MTFHIGEIVMFHIADEPAKVIFVCHKGYQVQLGNSDKRIAFPHEITKMRRDTDKIVPWADCDWMPKEMRA